MVVVATIGTMAALAIPSLQKYVHRAQRNEAYINLNGIFKAQKSYQTDTGVYGEDFDAIGFSIIGGILLDANTIESKYYTYTVNTWDDDGIPNSNFTAIATGDLDPRDAMLDIVMIESGLIVLD